MAVTSGSPVSQTDEPAEDQGGPIFNLLAGAALGGLVGLLIGLSATPVVASAAAAILALLVTFFGFGGSVGALRVRVSAARVLGFGIAMALFLVGGIMLRAHETLGPSFAERVDRFVAGGIDKERARDLAIYQHLGLRTGHLAELEAPATVPATSPYAFSLTEDRADPNCAALDSRYLSNPTERLRAMAQSPEPWASAGRSGLERPAAEHASIAEEAFRSRCGSLE